MKIKHIVGDNIRGYRYKQNWTQEKLAGCANITSQYISRLELGRENPKLSTLFAISKALKIELHQLFIEKSYNE